MKTTAAMLAVVMVAGVAMAQDTVQPQIAVDVLDVKESGIVAHLKNNWGKYLVGLAGAVAVEAAAENNDWLWHKPGSGDNGTAKPQTMDASTIEDNDFLDVTVIGEGNMVEVNVDYYEDRQP